MDATLLLMVVNEMTLLKRLTLLIEDGRVSHLQYPFFPPDEAAVQIINWLKKEA